MKLVAEPHYFQNIHKQFVICTLDETLYLKRKKDVNNYYYQLQYNMNDYLTNLLEISAKLDYIFSSNIKIYDRYDIKDYCKFKNEFYERLHYLSFYCYVESKFKLNALCTMTNVLIELSRIFKSEKIEKELLIIRESFFINNAYYKKEKQLSVVMPVPVKTKLKKAI